ncbi:hypothetical protein GF356_08415 [candidate division GN15 bacterium]|nr:hypothetical protein [candidate division GN15 bacterium]
MKRLLISALVALTLTAGLTIIGCDKERIVESSEKVQEIVEVTDTVFVRDTIYRVDSINTVDTITQYVGETDTIVYHDTTWRYDTTWRFDTTYITETDTVVIVDTVVMVGGSDDTVYVDTSAVQYDTIMIYDTTTITDTITQLDTIMQVDTVIQTQLDTVYQTQYVYDTVTISQCEPQVHFAYAALQGWGDIEVISSINAEYGYEDGWVFWLSIYMTAIENPSPGVYDFYGYIDYWSPDWSQFVPFEFGYRLTYISGDASDPNNWQLTDAPAGGGGGGAGAAPGTIIQRPDVAPIPGSTSGLRVLESRPSAMQR